jgi:hypothetical protein
MTAVGLVSRVTPVPDSSLANLLASTNIASSQCSRSPRHILTPSRCRNAKLIKETWETVDLQDPVTVPRWYEASSSPATAAPTSSLTKPAPWAAPPCRRLSAALSLIAIRRSAVSCGAERRAKAKGCVAPSPRWQRRGALFGVAVQRKNQQTPTISRKHPLGSDGKVPLALAHRARSRPFPRPPTRSGPTSSPATCPHC